MKHHRGYLNRGAWTRKTDPVEAPDPCLLFNNTSMRTVAKDELSAWEEPVRAEDNGWDTQTYNDTFYDDNKKIFQWDDSGAVEYLKKAQVKLQLGISSVYEDYLIESNQFLAPIDWDTRWLCTLPDCAEELTNREEKERRKNPKVNTSPRDPWDTSTAVILGLPEPHDENGCSGTPSLHLPLNFVPIPTGWGEAEDNQADEDSPMEPVTATNHEETQVEPTSQNGRHGATDHSEPLMTGSEWPEQPTSYQHIIPSGWEDDQVDQPVLSSGWRGGDREPPSDIHMQRADRWCGRPSYSNPRVLAESPQIYSKPHSGKQQDFYNKCQKYGYWRPKRGGETNIYESNGRKSMQRSGRPISTFHRVNHDSRSPRVNRPERSKSQWSTVDNIAHE